MTILYWDLLAEDGQTVLGQEGLSFDVTIREEVTLVATPTEFPVERGATISDHVQPGQLDMNLEVFVTDTPVVGGLEALPTDGENNPTKDRAPLPPGRIRNLRLPLPTRNPIVNTQTGQVQIIGGLPSQRLVLAGTPFREGNRSRSAAILQFDDAPNRVALVYEALTELIERGTRINVILGIARGENSAGRTFENMFLTNFRTPRTVESGSGLTFSLDLRQLTIVETRQDARKVAPREPQHKNKTDAGKRATAAPSVGTGGGLDLDALERGQFVPIG